MHARYCSVKRASLPADVTQQLRLTTNYDNNTPKYKRGRHSIDTACVVTLQAYSTSELEKQIKLHTHTHIH